MINSSKVYLIKLYPIIEKKMKDNSFVNKYKRLIGEYIQSKQSELYENAPYDRILFNYDEIGKFLKLFSISEKEINDLIKETYYYKNGWKTAGLTDPVILIMMCVIRYIKLYKKDKKLYELSIIYYSCKMYPSIHYNSFPIEPRKNSHVMEYVVNQMLTNKYDLKTEKNVIGVLKSRGVTCFDSYEKILKSFNDEDIVYIIQQMRTRIGSFLVNIAKLFYEAYDNKLYMTYDSDNLDSENFHLSDSDTKMAGRLIEKTITNLNSIGIDNKLILSCCSNKIKITEYKSIIEGIITDTSNNRLLKELITLIIIDFYNNSKSHNCASIEFLSYTLATKSNTKNESVIRIKDILIELLNGNSTKFRQTSRLATKNEYIKSLLAYITRYINNNAKNIY